MPLDRIRPVPVGIDTVKNRDADPLVVCLEDMGKHGIGAETYSLSFAITQAADFVSGEGGWRFLSVNYIDGDLRDAKVGAVVADFDAMVDEELKERAENEAAAAQRNRDYYQRLGVR